jgi:hypothetical protein
MFGLLTHDVMLASRERLPPGARELVSAHRYDKTIYPGCHGEEGFICELEPLLSELKALDEQIPATASVPLRALMVRQHRVLWDYALERAADRPELKTIGAWARPVAAPPGGSPEH